MRRLAALLSVAALATPTLLVVAPVLTGSAGAATAIPAPTGPPLGSYYTELKTCQKGHLFYENVCKQARIIVSNARLSCSNLFEAGIVVAALTESYAVLAGVVGITVDCTGG